MLDAFSDLLGLLGVLGQFLQNRGCLISVCSLLLCLQQTFLPFLCDLDGLLGLKLRLLEVIGLTREVGELLLA